MGNQVNPCIRQEVIKGGSVPTAKDPSPKGTFDRSGGTQMKNG
jgi:hypothetical protein